MQHHAGGARTPWASPRLALAALVIAVSLTAACSTDTEEPAQARPTPAPDDEFTVRRFAMVAAYADNDDITDSRVLKAMSTVRREEFVLPRDRERAYLERALAINAGQTISQPLTFIVRCPRPTCARLKTGLTGGALPFDRLRANDSPWTPFVLSLSKHPLSGHT